MGSHCLVESVHARHALPIFEKLACMALHGSRAALCFELTPRLGVKQSVERKDLPQSHSAAVHSERRYGSGVVVGYAHAKRGVNGLRQVQLRGAGQGSSDL